MDAEKTKAPQRNYGSVSGIFWGLLLIVVGGLFLAGNMGLVRVDWTNTWKLWPLMIIAVGVSMLAVKHAFWHIIKLILVGVALIMTIWVVTAEAPSARVVKSSEFSISPESNFVSAADIRIAGGAGDFFISSRKQDQILVSKLDSSISTITKENSLVGDIQHIGLTMKSNKLIEWLGAGSIKNAWNVNLSQDMPIDLSINNGASNTDIDVMESRIQKLNVNIGASSLRIKLGDIEDKVLVDLKSGASSVLIRVPSSSGIKVTLDGGLNSSNLADIEKTGSNTYESFDYANAVKKIEIAANIGVSSFTIERY
jgi:hypothetical protein